MGGGEGEATPAFQFPRKDLAGDRAVCHALRGPFGLPPHHLPTTLVVAPLGLTGQDPSRAGSHTGQRHPNMNTEGSPGSWALLSVAPGQPGRSTLRRHSHTGQARLPSRGAQRPERRVRMGLRLVTLGASTTASLNARAGLTRQC